MHSFDFDIFVSHASEDKDAFVRPLVEALEERHLSTWYDEHSLRPGDSLSKSIDHGLARSRFGLVIISDDFLSKNWPRAELAALTSRAHLTGERILLPVWLGVTAADVSRESPLLADINAIHGDRGIEYVADRVRDMVRPGASPIVVARELLADYGVATPPPSDAWWLDVIEHSASEAHWIWGFPLPEWTTDPSERGERLGWAAMQLRWINEASSRQVTELSHPDEVLAFIDEMPGLAEMCSEYPDQLATIVPLLTLPGFGGGFETLFDRWDEQETERLARSNRQGGSVLPLRRLDHSEWGDVAAADALVGHGFLNADYLFWLLSDASDWMPEDVRTHLVSGIQAWGAWLWDGFGNNDNLPERGVTGKLNRWIRSRESEIDFIPTGEALNDLRARTRAAIEDLALPETTEALVQRFIESGAIQSHVREQQWNRAQNGAG